MMSKFIELHDRADRKLLVNVENICDVYPDIDFESAVVSYVNGKGVGVTESYDEVKTLIKDAGILIHKPDPRLNLTKPLSMGDLRDMIGEPVWNSNTLKWELVWYYGDAKEIIFTRDCGADYEYNADDLIKTPLYRMKQEVK